MRNPRFKARNSKQIRSTKFQIGGGLARAGTRVRPGLAARSVLERLSAVPGLVQAASCWLLRWARFCQSAAEVAHIKRFAALYALFILAVSLSMAALAQYSLDWWTVDGGGGTSTGGVYTVTGTIGQSDAGPVLSGGQFTVTGGFWSVIAALQTPGAPELTVALPPDHTVVVSWPLAGAEGWVLQATNVLPSLSVSWPVIAPPYQTNGPNLQFIEPVPAGNKFYRLHKP